MKPPSVALNDGGSRSNSTVSVNGGSIGRRSARLLSKFLSSLTWVIPRRFGSSLGLAQSLGRQIELGSRRRRVNARLFAFPDFDHVAYERAREAEAKAQAGLVVCWRA
jgi:hypothetical protein